MTKVFNVLPSDRGRPITDLSSEISLPGFADDIGQVFAGRGPIERRVRDGKRATDFLVRLAPYRSMETDIQGVVVTFIDVSDLVRADARQKVLIAELQHRTRNLLALVQAIGQRTLGTGAPVAAFMTRLAALGRVQGLISDVEHDRVDLMDLVQLELQALGAPAHDKLSVTGESVRLGLEHVQTFGLAIHELATNAVKYGALKDGVGRLDVAWRVEADARGGAPVLRFDWRESGLATPPDGSRRGFGRELIERALTHTLRASTALSFTADGLSCRIEIPLTGSAAALESGTG